jgi:hypothetical protein
MHCGAEVTESSTNKQHHLAQEAQETHLPSKKGVTPGVDTIGGELTDGGRLHILVCGRGENLQKDMVELGGP